VITPLWQPRVVAVAFTQKTAAASLSRKKHLSLPLRFRAKNICRCRFAFAQKTSVALTLEESARPERKVNSRIGDELLYIGIVIRKLCEYCFV